MVFWNWGEYDYPPCNSPKSVHSYKTCYARLCFNKTSCLICNNNLNQLLSLNSIRIKYLDFQFYNKQPINSISNFLRIFLWSNKNVQRAAIIFHWILSKQIKWVFPKSLFSHLFKLFFCVCWKLRLFYYENEWQKSI